MRPCTDRDRSVLETLDRAADERPEAPALRDARGGWTYARLRDTSRAAARWLRAEGVADGDRVVVRATSDRHVVALMYACFRIGALFVPVSPTMRGYQLEHVLADSEPTLLITDVEDHLQTASTVRGRTLRDAVSGIDACVRDSEDTTLDSERAPQGTDVAMLLYTSGSTAQPKAVVCPQSSVAFAVSAVSACLRYEPDDVVYSRLPLSFDYGLYQTFLAAAAQCELVLADDSQDPRLLRHLSDSGATVVPLVPSLATMLLTLARRDSTPSRVRLFTNTGEHLPQATADQLRKWFPGAAVQMMFGTTECKRISILEPNAYLSRPGSVGRPLPGTGIVIVDDEGRALPAGEVGEITVRGPHLMSGYWRSPELTARTYRVAPDTGDRVLHTGDMGRLDAEGHLYFTGRKDDLFKRRGVRTSVLEIEAAAQTLPSVRAAALLPPAEDRDAVLFVVGDTTDRQALSDLARLLDPAKVPSVCRVVEALPVNANGKVDRAALHRWEGE